MNVSVVVTGLAALLLVFLIVFYTEDILQNIQVRKEEALAHLFFDWRAPRAFMVFSVSTFLFAAGSIIGGLQPVIGRQPADTAAQVGAVIGLLGLLYFLRLFALITE